MIALLLVVAVLSVAMVASVGITQRRIPSRGTVHVEVLGVEVYWDPECTSIVTEIEWGILEPLDVVARTVYLRNTGNAAVNLSMVTENWSPVEAETYITLTWDAEGTILDANTIQATIMNLSVSAEISGVSDFSFDIVITGGS